MENRVKQGRSILYFYWLLPAFFLLSGSGFAKTFADDIGHLGYGCWESARFSNVELLKPSNVSGQHVSVRFGCPNYNSAVAFAESFKWRFIQDSLVIAPFISHGPFSSRAYFYSRVPIGFPPVWIENAFQPLGVPSYLSIAGYTAIGVQYGVTPYYYLRYPSPQFDVISSGLELFYTFYGINYYKNPSSLFDITKDGRTFTGIGNYPSFFYENPDRPRQLIAGAFSVYFHYSYNCGVGNVCIARNTDIGTAAIYFLKADGPAYSQYAFPSLACVEESKSELSAKKAAIQQEGAVLFSGLTNSSAALPCYPYLCLTGMESQLQPVSNAFLLIGTLGAGFIVLRKKPKKGRERNK